MTTQDKTSTLNLNSIMIGSAQPQVVAEFYEKIFGRPADMADGAFWGWQVGSCFLMVGEHSEIKGQSKEPARVILNMETSDVRGEFDKLKQKGITVVKEPYSMGDENQNAWIATLADPDGNYLQLMSPMPTE